MSTSKRIISLLLALVMVLGMLPWDALGVEAAGLVETVQLSIESAKSSRTALSAVSENISDQTETTASETTAEVTRAQWIQMLVDTFSMVVEEDNYPDNYFSDLTGDEEYYRDILVAVEFGVIDLEAGLPFEAEAAATREFCAHTLNFCLGYQLGGDSAYTFAEMETVMYPDDIQIAINRGWFALESGAFLPEQPVTAQEMDKMMQDAAEVLASDVIDPDYQNSYEFTDEVIELSEQTAVYWESDDEISLFNPDQEIKNGDIFAVYEDGFPLICRAENVTKSGSLHTITITNLNINDYLVSVDAQGMMETDLADFEPAEGMEAVYILEDGSRVNSVHAAGTQKIKSIYLYAEFMGYKVDIEVYDMVLKWHSKGSSLKNADVSAVVTGHAFCNVTIPFGASVSDFSDVLSVGSVPIGPFGRISVTADISLDGSVSFAYGADFCAGVSYSYHSGFRIPMEFKKTHFSMCAEANIRAGVSASAGLSGIPLLSATCRATIGLQVNCTMRHRGEDVTPKLCIHTDAWLYCTVGAYATVGIKGWDAASRSWSDEIVIWDRNHSPVRSSTHFEDGTLVSICTYGDFDYVRYYSSGSSRYANGGISAVSNSPTYTYTIDDDGNATITGFSGNVGGISIPATIDGHPVTAIGNNAFSGKTSLYSVTIPGSVLSIGGGAFADCKNLRNLTLSEGLTEIGGSAFLNCTSLISVDFPDSMEVVGCGAFKDCTSLVKVRIPANMIPGSYAGENSYYPGPFHGCSSLTTITFADNITSIPAAMFSYCTGLKELKIPETVTSIGWRSFQYCDKLEAVYLPDSMEVLECGAFRYCTALKRVNIPKNMEAGSYAGENNQYPGPFYGCSSLTDVTFGEGITYIPSGMFYGCTGLVDVIIPDTVTSINYRAFRECSSLESIVLSSVLTHISTDAFMNCTALKEVELPTTMRVLGCGAFSECTSLRKINIPKNMDTGSYAGENFYYPGPFRSCSSLTDVVFEEGITRIPTAMFWNCTGLQNVDIPDTVTTLNYRSFAGCSALETVTIPNSVKTIGNSSFNGCTSLKEVVIPDSVTSLGNSVFSECSSLTSAEIPDSLTTIPDSTFYGCVSLSKVTLPATITAIKASAFYNCDAFTEFVIPAKVTSIGNSCFYDCDALISITIPYGVTSIGSSAFYDCDALETVDMANSVTSLGNSAFRHCDVLKNVKLSRNLATIPSEAFRECAELEQIVIPYFATKIEANAFNSSPKLTKVVVHEKLASINTSAFSYADRTVFYGPTGSYTNTWCTDNGYSFVENTVATTKVTAAESSVTIPKGKTYMLDFDIDPIDFHEVITTKSSNTAVATVDETGKITTVAPGTATIKIIVGGASASCKVTVTQAVTKITLNKTKLSLDVPQTYQLTATITPSDASNKTLNWTSSNPAAATVDANGLVTAVGNGTAVIKAESTDGTGISASCTVTVIDPSKIPVSGIALDKTSLSLEAMEDYQLTATVSPTNAANKGLIWSSSNEAVATVDSNGKVTAVAKGTATITATAADGYGASANCTVTVTNNGYLVTDLAQFQSSHPYADRCTDFWIYRRSGAGSLSITFAAETEIEDGFDYLYIYDGEGNLIGKYTGTELANQTITIPGDTVKVQIESDDSGNAWGFQVVDVEYTDHNHSFTNYVSDGNATCTQDGTKTAKCDHCDLTDTIADVGSALGHNMGAWNTVRSATCTENGEEQRNCTRCDHSENRTIEALGHHWDKGVVIKEPTEETEGERLYTCTACGATRTESIPVIGHEHSYETIVTAPTCTEQGYTTYTCRCGESYTADYVDALGHVWGDWIVIQEPTTTENGVEEHTCTRCGHAEQRSIAKLENPFSDVNPGSFFYEPVMWAIENGITNGTSATTFGPNDQCMRAHVVTFLWRAVGSPEPTRTDNPFVDVKPTDFYYKPVLWAVENGITSGMDATHFGPTAYCNRAQVVTFLYRTMGSPDVGAATNPFADVAAGSFYEKPVLWAVENGVTAGLSATSFGPNSICNRAQIVTFLYRAFVD